MTVTLMRPNPGPFRLWLRACALGLALLPGATATAAPVDRPAPELSLPDRTGAVVSLASLKGRVVLLDIWATWCPPCKASLPAYEAMVRDYRARGFEVLAVSVDEGKGDVEAFLKGRDLQLRVLLDPKGQTPTRFTAKAMPTSFLIDRRGVIRFTHEGFTEKAVAELRRQIEQLLAEPAE